MSSIQILTRDVELFEDNHTYGFKVDAGIKFVEAPDPDAAANRVAR